MWEVFMYHIIELENGQPMIFEQSARQIKSYLIANGRVFSKGYVFKDFKKDFNVYSVNSPLVSYYSVDNSFVLTQVTQNSFQEVLCLKTSCATLVFNNKLYVFYLDIPNRSVSHRQLLLLRFQRIFLPVL